MKTSVVRFFANAFCLIGMLLFSSPHLLAQTFTTTGSTNVARGGSVTATTLNNGMVLISGGITGPTNAELYNPSTGAFSYTANMPIYFSGPTATLLKTGSVLLNGSGAQAGSAAELYSPSTGAFTLTGNNAVQLGGGDTATLLSNGKVLLAGGYPGGACGRGGCPASLSNAELYDPSTGTFAATGSMTTGRASHTATLLSHGMVLIAGGYSAGYGLASAELYNPSTGTFTATGSMNIVRVDHLATLLGNGTVLIVEDGHGSTHAEIYDPSTGTFSYTGNTVASASQSTATLLNNGYVLIAGGNNSSGVEINTAELYNPSTGTFSSTGSLNTARFDAAAAALSDGTVLVVGGLASSGWKALSSAEIYKGVPIVSGFVNPKFVIVGLTYAPPGPSSNVTYTGSTLVGNTAMTTGSFTNDNNLTISVTNGIGAWLPNVAGFGVKITGTDSNDYTQGSNTSKSVTISKQTAVSYKTNGTGNAFSPVNHDYDTIWLWLNPLMIYTINLNNPSFLQWNGYGYDNNDVNGMEIYGVQVGCLNGHFGSCPSVQTVLARGWVTTNEPGMIWPSGEGPGLTSADIANILKADPFTSSYVLPSPLPSTTADGRFTQIPYPPNPVEYAQAGLGNGGGTTTMYNAVYTNTSTVGQGASYSYKQAFGTEALFKGGAFLANWQIDVKTTDTLTWTNTWQNTLTTTTTLTDALSVTGPGCPQTSPPCVPAYAGPGEFLVYQDNLYGTFMFYPGN
jgi:hypothetical protein